MPRLYNCHSEPVDLCIRCYPKTEAGAMRKYAHPHCDHTENSEYGAPDERGCCFNWEKEGDEIPESYEEMDLECENCGRKLTARDNGYF